MQKGLCCGGIDTNTCELIRIHNEHGGTLSFDTPFEIGDRWQMDVETAWNKRSAPHTEDKQTRPIEKIDNIGMQGIVNFINAHDFGPKLTRGSIASTFEGCLKLHGSKNFIDREHIPSFSTQFWIADTDLQHISQWDKHYYTYNNIRLKYVGFQNPIDCIPTGTIIRLSLAHWWNGDGSGVDKCYLQLSGWYIP